MRRRFSPQIHVLVVMCLWLPLLALRGQSIAPATQPRTGQYIFWKASSGSATVFLLGSLHLATPEMYPLPREIEDAFAASQTLALELDPTKVDPVAAARLMQEKGTYPEKETLETQLSRPAIDRVRAYCSQMNLPLALLNKYRPWAAELIIVMTEYQKIGLNEDLGVDLHFAKKAGDKKVLELETMESQFAVLSSGSAAEQEASLVYSIDHLSRMREEIREIVPAWLSGDTGRLERLLKDPTDAPLSVRKLTARLVDDRNGPMVTNIEKLLQGQGTSFVVVGAVHLLGQKGIVPALRRDKFEVVRPMVTLPETPATQKAGP